MFLILSFALGFGLVLVLGLGLWGRRRGVRNGAGDGDDNGDGEAGRDGECSLCLLPGSRAMALVLFCG
jgi:hypothetical protein